VRDLTIPIILRASSTGLALTGQLYDAVGDQAGDDITTGFEEIGGGIYEWRGQVSDDFSGSFRVLSGATVVASAGIEAPVDLDALTLIANDAAYYAQDAATRAQSANSAAQSAASFASQSLALWDSRLPASRAEKIDLIEGIHDNANTLVSLVNGLPSVADIASAVWGFVTRTLTSGGGSTSVRLVEGPYVITTSLTTDDRTIERTAGDSAPVRLYLRDGANGPVDISGAELSVSLISTLTGEAQDSPDIEAADAEVGAVVVDLDTPDRGTYRMTVRANFGDTSTTFGPIKVIVRP
jgi:hypothetical protein